VESKIQKPKFVQRASDESGHVLLITNEPDASFLSSLESAGLNVVDVCAALAAPVSLRRSRPQLVIASNVTEGLSIHELAGMLSRTEHGVPLILMGAEDATLVRRQEAMLAGAFDYFQIPAEFELLILCANQLVTLRQTMDQLRGEADLDHLTGLANRRRFRVALSREVERWRRYGVPCALLLLDIDHMKTINDTYGHPSGDLVIREIADILSRVSRDNDTAARLGGEEFALLVAGLGATKSELAAKRLLTLLAEQHIEGAGHITVSIGVAACPEHATSERTLYAASDAALYLAKNGGRNRVVVAPLIQEKLPQR
jgi:diguanylate cyclase (GGDEF)-like protein